MTLPPKLIAWTCAARGANSAGSAAYAASPDACPQIMLIARLKLAAAY